MNLFVRIRPIKLNKSFLSTAKKPILHRGKEKFYNKTKVKKTFRYFCTEKIKYKMVCSTDVQIEMLSTDCCKVENALYFFI